MTYEPFLPPGERPCCVYCGKELRPYTEPHYFGSYGDPEEKPQTIEDAQRRVNERIVSTKRSRDGAIWTVGTWDGVTYRDAFKYKTTEPLFCTQSCGGLFARAAYGAGYRVGRMAG